MPDSLLAIIIENCGKCSMLFPLSCMFMAIRPLLSMTTIDSWTGLQQ